MADVSLTFTRIKLCLVGVDKLKARELQKDKKYTKVSIIVKALDTIGLAWMRKINITRNCSALGAGTTKAKPAKGIDGANSL